MIENSNFFTYDGQNLSSFCNGKARVVAVTSNSMYKLKLSGTKRVLEEKIPGKSTPYFYGVDYNPQTFKIMIALDKPETVTNIRTMLKWLLDNEDYKELYFDSDPSKIYYTIFTGSPELTYIETSERNYGDDVVPAGLIGTIELTARCNSYSAYSPVQEHTLSINSNPDSFTITNPGDTKTYVNINITFPEASGGPETWGANYGKIIISNAQGNEVIFENIYEEKYINMNAGTRIIDSDINKDASLEQTNVYEGWNREYLVLETGFNTITVTIKNAAGENYIGSDYPVIAIQFQPVRFL